MKILKFGGSSLDTPERVAAACDIVRTARAEGEVAVVVSAFGGVTDSLLETTRLAERGEQYQQVLGGLQQRHEEAVRALAAGDEAAGLLSLVAETLRSTGELVSGVSTLREASLRTLDRIQSAGEILSAHIFAAGLRRGGSHAEACDARRLIVTEPDFGGARVDESETEGRLRSHFRERKAIQVVTGFIGATQGGETTTLGRGGSDYTASILGAALGAEAVELWTDVDGVMSADPRIVSSARPTRHLTYDELMELSHFGAKVVYPPSVHPLRSRSIPLHIKNTFRPAGAGTVVTAGTSGTDESPTAAVVGIASIPSVTLMRLEGDGMVGVPGIAMRLFGALARRGVSVIMISQASSEHSICFAVAPESARAAAEEVDEEFAAERRSGLIDDLVIENDLAIIAAVGAGMRERVGISGKLFGVLGRHGVNVRAVAQGSSELNISLAVMAPDEARAVNAIHDAFFYPDRTVVEVCVAGVGTVGGRLLSQIAARAESLEQERGLQIRLAGVADSRGALIDPQGLDPSTAIKTLKGLKDPAPHRAMVEMTAGNMGAQRVLVDCTAGDDVPGWYEELLASGATIVTANKRPLAGPLAAFSDLAGPGARGVYFETTVGAALPVLGTVRDMIATGDRIHRVEGLLSGTLGYITKEIRAGRPFSEAVRKAYDLGYTEPDPREDLGGGDVARKLLIMGRLAGWDLEAGDVQVESLLPDESWMSMNLDAFWKKLPDLDEEMATRSREAAASGEQLVYLASITDGHARVALEGVAPGHPCRAVEGTDNVFALTTDRYAESPLVLRGPGAGPDVTASGLLADILRAAGR